MKKVFFLLFFSLSFTVFSQSSSGCNSTNWPTNLLVGNTYTFSVPQGNGSGWNYHWVVSPSSKLQILSGTNQNTVQIKALSGAGSTAKIYVTKYKNGVSACADQHTVTLSSGSNYGNTCNFTLGIANCFNHQGHVARYWNDTSNCESAITKEEWWVYGGSFTINNSNYFMANSNVGDLWVVGNPNTLTTVVVKVTFSDGSTSTSQNTFDIYNGSGCGTTGPGLNFGVNNNNGDNLNDPKLLIYPNETKGKQIINLNLKEKSSVNIIIRDINGIIVHKFKNDKLLKDGSYNFDIINSSVKKKGVYIVDLIVNGKKIKTEKIIH